MGLAGETYFGGALVLGLRFCALTLRFAQHARRPRRAPAVLRIDHLPAADLDPDDRRQD